MKYIDILFLFKYIDILFSLSKSIFFIEKKDCFLYVSSFSFSSILFIFLLYIYAVRAGFPFFIL